MTKDDYDRGIDIEIEIEAVDEGMTASYGQGGAEGGRLLINALLSDGKRTLSAYLGYDAERHERHLIFVIEEEGCEDVVVALLPDEARGLAECCAGTLADHADHPECAVLTPRLEQLIEGLRAGAAACERLPGPGHA